ncbi:MAG: TonB-dependent receptor [Actinomycetota bacterium]
MSCNPKLKLSAVAVLAALSANIAQAEEQTLSQVNVQGQAERADGPVKGYRATRSATVTKTDTALRDVPQSIQVVPEEVIKDQGMTSIAQVLRYVPGTSVNLGEGGRDQPVLRGMSTNADFFIDGVRDDALYFRDPYNSERVEILKGPSGMAFGRGGAGGVINRVSKRPLEVPQNKADVTIGSCDAKRATVDLSDRISPTAGYRINAMVEDSGGFRQGYQLNRNAINPVFEFSPGAGTSLILSYEHLYDHRTVDRGISSLSGRPYNTSRETFFGNPDQSPSRITVDSFSARLEHGLTAATTVRNTFRATHYDTYRQNVESNSVIAPSGLNAGTLTIAAYAQANQRDNFFNQTEMESRQQIGGMEHVLLAGLELGRQVSDNTRITGFFNTAPGQTALAANGTTIVASGGVTARVAAISPHATVASWGAQASDANNRTTANVVALYVQDQVTLTPEWKAIVGLRHDRYSVAVDDKRAVNQDLSHTDKEFSPRAGLVWQPNAASSYYASYSYTFIPSGETLSLSTSNADLAPEKAENWEVGGKWDLSPRLSATAALFRLDRSNVKTRDPNDNTKLVLAGLQRTDGVEFGVQGQVTNNWQVFAGYAHLDAEVVKAIGGSSSAAAVPAGRAVALVPKNAVSVWNKVDLRDGWGVGLGVVYQSSVYASTNNAVTLPSFVRADGAVYYQIDKKTRLALNVENLFDRNYYATAGNDNQILPGSPRNARLTLSTSF